MSVKISIGTNYYKDNKRQSIARETHSLIQKKYNNVNVFNIQFSDETENHNPDCTIENLHVLTRSSRDIISDYNFKLPFINDIFNSLNFLRSKIL
jgi:hypothetical protein